MHIWGQKEAILDTVFSSTGSHLVCGYQYWTTKKYLLKGRYSISTTKDIAGIPVLKLLRQRPIGILTPPPMFCCLRSTIWYDMIWYDNDDKAYLEYAGTVWCTPGIKQVVFASTDKPLATVSKLQWQHATLVKMKLILVGLWLMQHLHVTALHANHGTIHKHASSALQKQSWQHNNTRGCMHNTVVSTTSKLKSSYDDVMSKSICKTTS